MEDQDRNQDSINQAGVPPADTPIDEGEAVPVPSRIRSAVSEVRQRIKDEIDAERDVVREYEERYYGAPPGSRRRLEAPPADETGAYAPGKTKRKHDPSTVDKNERKWAALAHASTLLTALVALGSGGLGVLITMFVPLLIYFAFRNRSEFVAFHALQAFTIQLVGTIGWLALVVTGLIVWVILIIISALLILVVVGVALLPIVVLSGVLLLVISLALPLGMVIYSVIAAVETYAGRNYRIPYIARWVESQMYSSFLGIL